MNKEFVPYEIALALKELGFDEIVLVEYNSAEIGKWSTEEKISSVRHGYQIKLTYGQAFRWFRESHGLKSSISYSMLDDTNWYFQFDKSGIEYGFKTYEEAELACLEKLIEIVKEK